MSGEDHLQGLGQILQQMEAIGHLHGLRRALAGTLSVAPARSRAITVTPGCSRSQVAKVLASRLGRSATGRCRSRSTSTVP